MKIAVTYSSKTGLQKEYERQKKIRALHEDIPADFFAEGDSMETIDAVLAAFRKKGHSVQGIEADDRTSQALEEGKPELVFNIAEGLFGDFRESYVPMICERLGVPYSGSDPLTLAICLNKARTKEVLSYHRVANTSFRVFYPGEAVIIDDITFPVIIKPVSEGSSKGIFDNSVVDDFDSVRDAVLKAFELYRQPVIVEQFLGGDEFTVALWGNNDQLEVLPIVAFNYASLPSGARHLYSYEAKWIWDTPEKPLNIFECPARISSEMRERIEELTREAYHVLGIRDWCRIDVRLDHAGEPHILEVNPLPGILPNPEDNSCFPKAARTAGYSYEEMLENVLRIAARRYGFEE